MFYSIKNDWKNILTNHANVKESIPEFYGYDTSFLINKQKLNLGKRQNQKIVNVILL
jgi:factor associated with neutral sphingomyelinase activation